MAFTLSFLTDLLNILYFTGHPDTDSKCNYFFGNYEALEILLNQISRFLTYYWPCF